MAVEISFYPRATPELIKASEFTSEYSLYYFNDENEPPIQLYDENGILRDKSNSWKIENDGICFSCKVNIPYVQNFYGTEGIVPLNSELGVCILWRNKAAKLQGCILPERTESVAFNVAEGNENRKECLWQFSKKFSPGFLKGDITFDIVLYVKKSASDLLEGEEYLANKAGIKLEVLDSFGYYFDPSEMDFPFYLVDDKNKPLWWMKTEFDDPRVDRFDEEHIQIYLNISHPDCPLQELKVKNSTVLAEILTSVYSMLFYSFDPDQQKDTHDNKNLEEDSISYMIHQLYLERNENTNFVWYPQEALRESLSSVVADKVANMNRTEA